MLFQIALLGEPLGAGGSIGLRRDKNISGRLYLPPNVATLSLANPSVVAQMPADVAGGPNPLHPFPTADLACPPVAHGGDTPEPAVAEVLEERSEVFFNFFSWVPPALERLLEFAPEVETVPLLEVSVRYTHANQGGLSLFP